MEKIKATGVEVSISNKNIDDIKALDFGHFYVINRTELYYSVCDLQFNEITSGPTLNDATKKSKLLELGYRIGHDAAMEWYE